MISKFQRRSQAFRIQKNSLGATFCSGTLFFPEGSVMYIRVEGTAKADPLDIELKHACGTCQHRHSWIC
ncbi:hypothetical protein BDL97_06G096900 [Sphagnum fallax]|nr:hypothetical protein BDL97_06G096900 [Sphagnum fallax]